MFYIARWGMRVSILVFAFERGGVEETGLVAVILEVPAAVVAPMASVIGDKIRRDRALLAGYAVQAAALAGTAGAIYADAPVALVYGLAAVATGCMTLTRPVQSALFPQLAHSPDQLVAANVVAGSISAAMAFVGPVASGVLLAFGGAALALAVFSGLLLTSALLVIRLEPHPPSARIGGHPLHEVAAGFRAVAREPDQRLVIGLLVGQSFVRGTVDVLVVVVALDLFELPSSAVGFLASALGAGGLLGAMWGLRLVGTPRLAAALALGLLVYGFGVSALAPWEPLWPSRSSSARGPVMPRPTWPGGPSSSAWCPTRSWPGCSACSKDSTRRASPLGPPSHLSSWPSSEYAEEAS
jgi:MFS family permease